MQLTLDATPEDLKVFLEEAEEQLQLLDADLIKLEKAGADQELLQEIFRVAHTLKGSSASIGHNRMAELTHAMESVLDGLRHGAIEVSSDLMDVLLESLDALSILTNEVSTSQISECDLTPLVSRLLSIAEQVKPVEAVKPAKYGLESVYGDRERATVHEHEALGDNIYLVEVEIDHNALLPAARCTQVLIEIATQADVVCSVPSLVDLEDGASGESLWLVCATRCDTDQVVSIASSVVDVVSVRVEPFREDVLQSASRTGTDTDSTGPRDERAVDLGPEARGKSQGDLLHIASSKAKQQTKTVRIDVERLDKLMNLVGELVIDNTRLARIAGHLQAGLGDEDSIERLSEASSHLSRVTNELQQEIMKSRMVPVGNIFNKFPRMVRNLAQKMGKDVDLIVQGQDTELDRSVIEEIGDPLIHLLRNAVDHGIENSEERLLRGKSVTGTVRLSAYHQEDHIVIMVEDDGRGLDAAKLRAKAVENDLLTQETADRLTDQEAVDLIFAPGFSTAATVSEVSGRGVGMDIVRTNIERLNGSVSVETAPGRGSRFTIQLPLTLAIIRALLVSVAETVFAIPLVFVTEAMRVGPEQIHRIRTQEAVLFRGQVLPLLRLRQVFSTSINGNNGAYSDEKRIFVVAVKYGGRQVGLVVDALIGEQEVVIKSLGKYVGDVKVVSGAAILGDGRVGLIVDAPGLVQVAIDERMEGLVTQ